MRFLFDIHIEYRLKLISNASSTPTVMSSDIGVLVGDFSFNFLSHILYIFSLWIQRPIDNTVISLKLSFEIKFKYQFYWEHFKIQLSLRSWQSSNKFGIKFHHDDDAIKNMLFSTKDPACYNHRVNQSQ